MSGKSEFAEGLAKAAREAYDEVLGGADDAAKARRQRAIDAAKKKDSPEAYHARAERRRIKAAKIKGEKIRKKRARSRQKFAETVGPVKRLLRKRNMNWSTFAGTRMAKDPNISKLPTTQAKRERVRELFDELGEEGFIKRFNL